MKKGIAEIGFFLLACTVRSQGQTPYGMEFHVNTNILHGLWWPHTMTALSDGGFVVCWTSHTQDGSVHGVYGQLFDQKGSKKGVEFTVNDDQGAGSYATVEALPGGGFAVFWSNQGQVNSDFYGQIYNHDGAKKGAVFKLDIEHFYDIVVLPSGAFFVCGPSHHDENGTDIVGQLINSKGSKIGEAFEVDAYSRYGKQEFSTAVLDGGGYVVCWMDYDFDENEVEGIFGQLFDAEGSKIGGTFRASTDTLGDQFVTSVSGLKGGGFVVCWQSSQFPVSGNRIFGQTFDSEGLKKGPEFPVSAPTQDEQMYSSVAGLSNGGFIVCWQGCNMACGIKGQIYDSWGMKVGVEFKINNYTQEQVTYPSVVLLQNGDFVVSWERPIYDWSTSTADWVVNDLYAKLFPSSPLTHKLMPFALRGPSIDATLKPDSVTFEWNQASREIRCYPWEIVYELTISTDPEYTSPLVVKVIEDTAYVLGNLRPGHTYFWKVLAKNIAGDSLWCQPSDWGFFLLPGDTADVLQPTFRDFWLVNPRQEIGSDPGKVVLNWQRASNEKTVYPPLVYYDVQVADNPAFTDARVIRGINDTTCTVGGLSGDRTYYWKVAGYSSEGDSLWSRDVGQIQVIPVEPEVPRQFRLYANYPNPFNSGTSIRFDIPIATEMHLDIYDIRGKRMVRLFNGSIIAGSHTFAWQGKNSAGDPVPSGIYICRLEARSNDGRRFVQSMKMGLVR
jgi:hypothetical protein